MKNYYATLEVSVDSDLIYIRESYRRLLQVHFRNSKSFEEIREAYSVLGDAVKRQEYDRKKFGETTAQNAEKLQMTNESNYQAAQIGGKCPMGAGSMCPVVNGHVPLQDRFCPECGVELAQLAAMNAQVEEAPQYVQPTVGAWFEEDTGRQHHLIAGANSVGRETGEVILPDKTVSREHARVMANPDDTITVEDLASTNGTKINGERLTPHFPRPINDMDTVTFGSVLTRLHTSAPKQQPVYVQQEVEIPTVYSDTHIEGDLEAYPEQIQADRLAQVLTNFDVDERPRVSTGVKLIGIRGDVVEEIPLVPGVTTFGRLAENTIVISNDPYVSGQHAQILAQNNTFQFIDVGSTNGSRLNGVKVAANEPLDLNNGDEISIGGSIFRLEIS